MASVWATTQSMTKVTSFGNPKFNKSKKTRTMKKIFYILASAIVALGAVACDNEGLDNIAPEANGDTVSFVATIDNTKTDLDENLATVWTAGDVIKVEWNGKTYHFTNSDDDVNTFSCTDEGLSAIKTAEIKATYSNNNDGAIDSEAGTEGALLTYEGAFSGIIFDVKNAFLKFTATEGAAVTLTASAKIFSTTDGTTFNVIATGEAQYVAINPATTTITYAIGGKTVKTSQENTLEAKKVYNLGELVAPATTIAEILATEETFADGTFVEGVVISNSELNNLTSMKGLYIQDETAGLQFYCGANHSFKFGDKVKVDLSGLKLAAYNGAVQISGIALDKFTVLSSGNAVEAKTVTMADFLANKYESQYIALENVQIIAEHTVKTWIEGGNHTNISIEDANGNKFSVFSSKYASYGAETVPFGAGTIKGIASINNDNLQIIFAQKTDYAGLTGERFGDTSPRILSVSPEALSFTASGDSQTIIVKTFGNATLATTVPNDYTSWLEANVGENGTVNVLVVANEKEEKRSGSFTITYGEDSKEVTVEQAAYVAEGVVDWYSESWKSASSHINSYTKGTISGDLGTWTYDGCSTYDEGQFTSKVGLALGKTADIKDSTHTAPIIVSPTFENGIQGIKFNYFANSTSRKVVIKVYENNTLISSHTVKCATKSSLTAAEITVSTTGSTYFEFVGDGSRRFSIGDIQVKY